MASTLPPDERLRPAVIGYWWCSSLAGTAVLAALGWFLARPLLAEHWDGWQPGYELLLLVGLGVLVFANVVAPPLAWYRWRFRCHDDMLWMRYGILFVEERAVPVRRMQHVDLMRGPVERLFGLATLVVFTAGNEGSAFRVPGLSAGRARELRDRIVEARGDGRV